MNYLLLTAIFKKNLKNNCIKVNNNNNYNLFTKGIGLWIHFLKKFIKKLLLVPKTKTMSTPKLIKLLSLCKYEYFWKGSPPNSTLSGRRSRCTQLLIQHFTKSWNICERTWCDKVLLYVANKFLWFDLRQCLCSRYCDILKLGGK